MLYYEFSMSKEGAMKITLYCWMWVVVQNSFPFKSLKRKTSETERVMLWFNVWKSCQNYNLDVVRNWLALEIVFDRIK